MAHWTDENKERIRKLLLENGCIAQFSGIGPRGSTTQSICYFPEHPDIVIGYNSSKSVYYIWNAYLHPNNSSFSNSKRVINSTDVIISYEPLHDGKQNYEKKLIVPESMIEKFCSHWYEYLLPNSEDSSYINGISVLWADRENVETVTWSKIITENDEQSVRNQCTTKRYERDPNFREKVLSDYNNECAICRCSIKQILEAHHIKYVSNNGSDNIQNGVCLCRNHHQMIHAGIITLNSELTEYQINDSYSCDISIQSAIELYNKKLSIPNRKK